MRRLFTSLLLSLFILSGTGMALADRHDNRDRKEHRQDNKRPGYGKHDDKRPGFGNNNATRPGNNGNNNLRPGNGHNNHRPGGNHGANSNVRPGHGQNNYNPAPRPNNYYRPTPPPPPGYRPAPYPIHDNLGAMVSYATRGGHDIAVWQVDYDTYVVRFRKGNNYYTQYIYPYAGRYGTRSRISLNWSPLSPWTLIPNVQLNINL